MDKNFDKFKMKLLKIIFFISNNYWWFLTTTNKILINNNNFNTIYVYNLDFSNNKNFIPNTKTIEPSRINKINIYGNDITKDKTIRSKLSFEPGDYFNDNLQITKKELLKNKYINDVTITNEIMKVYLT